MYDKFGKNAFSQGDMSEVNPFDIFNNIFSSGGFQMNDMSDFQEFNMRQFHGMSGIPGMSGVNIRVGGNDFNRQRQSSNIQKIIEITLEESYIGLKKNIEFTRTINNTKKNTNLQIDIPKGSLNNTKLVKKG
jgi:DnaJ-class molecular chaperone